ncbi:MAG: DUF4286 family protein [Reichenbachiella sp.]
MILYNITVNVDLKVSEKWLEWMKTEHIPEIMRTELFLSFKIFKMLNEDPQGITYACQYFAKSMEDVLLFQEKHGANLQSKMYQKFGNSTADFRSMLEEVV